MTQVQGPTGEVARLRRLDLNLLVVLDCLLVERGVSKAARRLRLSQSTVSDSLARLRRHFDDPLLQGTPRSYELSPLAHRLQPLVVDAVHAVDRVFAAASRFDPSNDAVEFRFLASDHALSFAAGRLSRAISDHAQKSRVRMAMFPPGGDAVQLLRDVDGVILPQGEMPDELVGIDLGSDDVVLVRDRESIPVGSVEEMSLRPWAIVDSSADRQGEGFRQLVAAGVRLRVEIELPSVSLIPDAIEGTQRLALLPRSLAQKAAHWAGIALQDPPVRLDPTRIALWLHPDRTDDAVHTWLRDIVS